MNIFPEACMQMDILQGWTVVETIGSGSYGTVYKVRQDATGKEAALKWIHIERNEKNNMSGDLFLSAQTRLLNEIGVLRSLSDTPEIVSIQDYAYQISPDGKKMDSFIRMELLTPLLELLKKDKMTVQQVTDLVNDIGRALQTCHERNIVHGDVKPENILLGQNKYKLSDFGVSFSELFSNRQFPPGTQAFRPLEYEQGMPASAQGDIYSFGMMVYVLFNNGLLPFQGQYTKEDEIEACQKWRDNARRPGTAAFFPMPCNAAGIIGEIICKAISPDPAQRYQTVQAFVNDFNKAVSALSESEKGMYLPYGRQGSDASDQSRVYLSTGRVTPRYDVMPEQTAATKDIRKVQAQQSGFVMPDEKKETPKPVKNAEKAGSKKEPEEKKKSKKPMVVAAVAILLLGILAALVLPGMGALEYESTVGATGVDLVITSAGKDQPCTVSCVPRNSQQAGVSFQARAGSIRLEGLVPDTEYSVQVQVNGKTQTIPLKTKPAENGRFQPVSQRLYLGKAMDIKELPEEKLTEITVNGAVIRNGRLQDQGQMLVFTTSSEAEPLTTEQETEMTLVLRTADGAVYTQTEKMPAGPYPEYLRLVCDVTALFDAYYNDFGMPATGRVTLEMYWLDELLGAAEANFIREGD
ncbi:MAG: serine/threonine protein kinase [Clostridia bacterium]|nr:serine/threonine protein kinase [Clostridia bacterium]